MRRKWSTTGTAKPKSAKRLCESAARLEKFYGHLFTGQVDLSVCSGDVWVNNMKELIEIQQKMPLWISQELDDLLNTG